MANKNQRVTGSQNVNFEIINISNLTDRLINDTNVDILNDTEINEIYNILIKSCSKYVQKKSKNKILVDWLRIKEFQKLLAGCIAIIYLLLLSFNINTSSNVIYSTSKFMSAASQVNLIETIKTPSENNEAAPVMTFIVGEHPGARGTYIYVKDKIDGKYKMVFDGIFKEGTEIKFFKSPKKVVLKKTDADPIEYNLNSNIIKLKVANHFTEIHQGDEVYKNLYIFRYDFDEDRIIK